MVVHPAVLGNLPIYEKAIPFSDIRTTDFLFFNGWNFNRSGSGV